MLQNSGPSTTRELVQTRALGLEEADVVGRSSWPNTVEYDSIDMKAMVTTVIATKFAACGSSPQAAPEIAMNVPITATLRKINRSRATGHQCKSLRKVIGN